MSRPTTLHVGGTLYWVIQTRNPDTLVLKDADSTPTVAVRKNGSSVGDSVTITKRSATTGLYDCSYNPASEVEGDKFTLEESATVTGTTTSSATYVNSFDINVLAVERGTDSAALASGVTVTSIGSGVITAESIASDAITDAKVASDVTIASVTGAVGSVTGNVGGNVVGSVASVVAGVDLSTTALGAIWNRLTSSMTTAGSIGKKLADWVVGTIDTYTGNTPQTGDSYARIGATGSGLTSLASQASVDAIPTAAENRAEMDSNSTRLGICYDVAMQFEGGSSDVGETIRDFIGLAGATLDTQISDLATDIDGVVTSVAAIKDRVSYGLTVLVGACADAGTAAETYVHAIGGETFTVDFTGLDATGNRTTTTLSKV